LCRKFRPHRVILFGSHARGAAGADSDVDLLIVMPVSGPKRERQIEIGVALHRDKVPMDIIVTAPEEFAWRKEVRGTVERAAALGGKVLHASE